MKKLTAKEDSHVDGLIMAMNMPCFDEYTKRARVLLGKVQKLAKTHQSYEFSPRLFYGLMIRTAKRHGCYVNL